MYADRHRGQYRCIAPLCVLGYRRARTSTTVAQTARSRKPPEETRTGTRIRRPAHSALSLSLSPASGLPRLPCAHQTPLSHLSGLSLLTCRLRTVPSATRALPRSPRLRDSRASLRSTDARPWRGDRCTQVESAPPHICTPRLLPRDQLYRARGSATLAAYSATYRAILKSPATGATPWLISNRTTTLPSFLAGQRVPVDVLWPSRCNVRSISTTETPATPSS